MCVSRIIPGTTMDIINAIAKARFSATRPQHIQLHKSDNYSIELICLESGQDTPARTNWVYYVITGNTILKDKSNSSEISPGQLAVCQPNENFNIANDSENRLVILAVGS